jgi:hypothetical protein
MPPTRILWHLRNLAGDRALCYLSPEPDGRLLLVERAGHVIVAEHHQSDETVLQRADVIAGELRAEGWFEAPGRTEL